MMRSMYFAKVGQHVAGHFVQSILDRKLEAVTYADNLNSRAIKLYLWFDRNELSGVRIQKEEEESLTRE